MLLKSAQPPLGCALVLVAWGWFLGLSRVESGSLLTPVLDRDPHRVWDRAGPSLTQPASPTPGCVQSLGGCGQHSRAVGTI